MFAHIFLLVSPASPQPKKRRCHVCRAYPPVLKVPRNGAGSAAPSPSPAQNDNNPAASSPATRNNTIPAASSPSSRKGTSSPSARTGTNPAAPSPFVQNGTNLSETTDAPPPVPPAAEAKRQQCGGGSGSSAQGFSLRRSGRGGARETGVAIVASPLVAGADDSAASGAWEG